METILDTHSLLKQTKRPLNSGCPDFLDRESGKEMVEDALEFLRHSGSKKTKIPEYKVSVSLRSPQSTYETDLHEFEAFLSSVRFTKPKK
jgi:hypothetical protein